MWSFYLSLRAVLVEYSGHLFYILIFSAQQDSALRATACGLNFFNNVPVGVYAICWFVHFSLVPLSSYLSTSFSMPCFSAFIIDSYFKFVFVSIRSVFFLF